MPRPTTVERFVTVMEVVSQTRRFKKLQEHFKEKGLFNFMMHILFCNIVCLIVHDSVITESRRLSFWYLRHQD